MKKSICIIAMIVAMEVDQNRHHPRQNVPFAGIRMYFAYCLINRANNKFIGISLVATKLLGFGKKIPAVLRH